MSADLLSAGILYPVRHGCEFSCIRLLDWASDGIDGFADHVGIVERCEGGVVYTVEGNMTNSCKQRQYTVGYYEICGYGVPAY